MMLLHQRVLRRLRRIVKGVRPGSGQGVVIEGYRVLAWHGWDYCLRARVEALLIETMDCDEAARLAIAYWGKRDFACCQIETHGGPHLYWLAERALSEREIVQASQVGGPCLPFFKRIHDVRVLGRSIERAPQRLIAGGVELVAAED